MGDLYAATLEGLCSAWMLASPPLCRCSPPNPSPPVSWFPKDQSGHTWIQLWVGWLATQGRVSWCPSAPLSKGQQGQLWRSLVSRPSWKPEMVAVRLGGQPCTADVASCVKVPLPWLPCHSRLYLELRAKATPFSFKLLLLEWEKTVTLWTGPTRAYEAAICEKALSERWARRYLAIGVPNPRNWEITRDSLKLPAYVIVALMDQN